MRKTGKVFLAISVCVLTLLMSACKKDATSFKHGTVSANSYTSDFLGIKIQAGSGWTMLSDADLAKLNSVSDMSESNIRSVLDKGAITEAMVTKDNGSSITITVVQDDDKTISVSEEEYFNDSIDFIKSQFGAAGYTYDVKKSSVNFLGKSTDCLELSLTVVGTTVHEIQIPIFKSHYTASISFESLNKSDLQTILDMFTAV